MTAPRLGEPPAGPWRAVPLAELVTTLRAVTGTPIGRPAVIAVDGRSASGKSTLARRLAQAFPRCAVVHTDDVAWHEPFFAWAPLLVGGVLEPLHRGEPVRYRPPAWAARGREGAVEVPAGVEVVVVEGVGASQGAVSPLLDAAVWVQSDETEAERRGIARDIRTGVNGDVAATVAFWHEWKSEETAFLARDRPWERACVVVAGTPAVAHGPDDVVVADGPLGVPVSVDADWSGQHVPDP